MSGGCKGICSVSVEEGGRRMPPISLSAPGTIDSLLAAGRGGYTIAGTRNTCGGDTRNTQLLVREIHAVVTQAVGMQTVSGSCFCSAKMWAI